MPLAALLNLSQKLTLQSTGAKPRSWQLRKAFVSKGIRPLSAGLSFHDLSPEQLVKSDQWDIFQHLWQIISHYKGALNSNDLNNNNESEKTGPDWGERCVWWIATFGPLSPAAPHPAESGQCWCQQLRSGTFSTTGAYLPSQVASGLGRVYRAFSRWLLPPSAALPVK